MDKSMHHGIIGAGYQGKGIAYWFARQGFATTVYDIDSQVLATIAAELEHGKGPDSLAEKNF